MSWEYPAIVIDGETTMTKEQVEAELRLFKAYSQKYEDYPVYENTVSVGKGILYSSVTVHF